MKYTLGLKQLPFVQDTKDILYVENNYDQDVNAYIQKNYERIAHNYYIDGKRGEAKKILLPREMIVWE